MSMRNDQSASGRYVPEDRCLAPPWIEGAATPGERGRGFGLAAADRLLVNKMLQSLGGPPITIVLWNGEEIAGRGGIHPERVFIRDRGALLKLVANPEYWFGDLYVDKRIEIAGDLLTLIEAVYRSLQSTSKGPDLQKRIAEFLDSRRNSLDDSRRNIHHHYDIGNEFYRLWLDGQMAYTCAYFPEGTLGLEAAQVAKMDHICRKLWLKPGENVVEAGCGWGAMALHMARHYGVTVKAFNISTEQLAFARDRARAEGLQDRVEFIEDDYRNLSGEFDAFVSVGMLEHVGPAHYQGLGGVIRRSLKVNGRGLIHSIGRDSPGALNAWIARRIFPGARPPSLSQMMQIFEPAGFSVLDIENLRLHYARTLEHWLQRFEASADRVAGMFDPAFVRAWRLYLAGSVAAFRSGDMQLFQVVFARSGCNDIPWTRLHQYPR